VKHTIDIQVVLATVEDMDFWDDRADEATDKMNTILHMLYDKADEDINSTYSSTSTWILSGNTNKDG
jgi:hypothetical protein